MLKQITIKISQLEKAWAEMNKLNAGIIFPSSSLQREFLPAVQVIPRKNKGKSSLLLFKFELLNHKVEQILQLKLYLGNM